MLVICRIHHSVTTGDNGFFCPEVGEQVSVPPWARLSPCSVGLRLQPFRVCPLSEGAAIAFPPCLFCTHSRSDFLCFLGNPQ